MASLTFSNGGPPLWSVDIPASSAPNGPGLGQSMSVAMRAVSSLPGWAVNYGHFLVANHNTRIVYAVGGHSPDVTCDVSGVAGSGDALATRLQVALNAAEANRVGGAAVTFTATFSAGLFDIAYVSVLPGVTGFTVRATVDYALSINPMIGFANTFDSTVAGSSGTLTSSFATYDDTFVVSFSGLAGVLDFGATDATSLGFPASGTATIGDYVGSSVTAPVVPPQTIAIAAGGGGTPAPLGSGGGGGKRTPAIPKPPLGGFPPTGGFTAQALSHDAALQKKASALDFGAGYDLRRCWSMLTHDEQLDVLDMSSLEIQRWLASGEPSPTPRVEKPFDRFAPRPYGGFRPIT